jgi:SHS2 domain-containing protein
VKTPPLSAPDFRTADGESQGVIMYETFPHTADLGLRIRAEAFDALLSEAGRALFATLLANLDEVLPVEKKEFLIEGSDPEFLLFDWLNELLYRFHSDQLVLAEFETRVDSEGLRATCRGETLDLARHRPDHDVKAITYHGLKVVRNADEWLAEVIVDI